MIHIPFIFLLVILVILLFFKIKNYVDFTRREPEIEPLIIEAIEWTKLNLNNNYYSKILDTIIIKNFRNIKIIKLQESFSDIERNYKNTFILIRPIAKLFKIKYSGKLTSPKPNIFASLFIVIPFVAIIISIIEYNFNIFLSSQTFLCIIIFSALAFYIKSVLIYSNKITIYYEDCKNNNHDRDMNFKSIMIHELIHFIHFHNPKNKFMNMILPLHFQEGLSIYFQSKFLIEQNFTKENIVTYIKSLPEEYYKGYQFVNFYIDKKKLHKYDDDTIMFQLLNISFIEVCILLFQFNFKDTFYQEDKILD